MAGSNYNQRMTKRMETEQAVVYHGNCLDELKNIPDNHVDAIVTDPPYGLGDSDPDYILSALKMWMNGDRSHIPAGKGFMGKQWDAFVPPPAVWDECFRVLKPGGHMLVFAGTRTIDLMGLSVRMAGFEIRDSLTWIYAQGFPKSLDISKAIDKAAGAERKVIGKAAYHSNQHSFADAGKYSGTDFRADITAPATPEAQQWSGWGTALKPASEPILMARKTLSEKNVAQNVLKWGTGGLDIDGSKVGTESNRYPSNVMLSHAEECDSWCVEGCPVEQTRDASKFFFVSKATTKDRNSGEVTNIHPTVKPTDLMRYLVKMVCPEGAIVLDPFTGSGSTGKASILEGRKFIGIEMTDEYLPIIETRLTHAMTEARLDLPRVSLPD